MLNVLRAEVAAAGHMPQRSADTPSDSAPQTEASSFFSLAQSEIPKITAERAPIAPFDRGYDRRALIRRMNAAAARGDNFEVGSCVLRGLSPNARPDNRTPSALYAAVERGDLQMTIWLLRHGALASQLTYVAGKGHRPLHRAVETRRGSLVHALAVHQPQSLHVGDDAGQTALHLAAAQGGVGMVELLLCLGANRSICNRRGETPLHLAAKAGSLGSLVALLTRHREALPRLNSAGRQAEAAIELLCGNGDFVYNLLCHWAALRKLRPRLFKQALLTIYQASFVERDAAASQFVPSANVLFIAFVGGANEQAERLARAKAIHFGDHAPNNLIYGSFPLARCSTAVHGALPPLCAVAPRLLVQLLVCVMGEMQAGGPGLFTRSQSLRQLWPEIEGLIPGLRDCAGRTALHHAALAGA
ncbi:MAG: ankyrin repeat domain-containing protein, partial [Deltaproteobacteria bacterium]